MESHTCKLCSRSFSNGRSLGGHMRFHMIHPQPPTPPLHPPNRRLRLTVSPPVSASHSPSPSFSYCSASNDDDGEANVDSSYGLRENPKRSVRLIDPEFSSSTVLDRESETESCKMAKSTRPRSNRARRRLVPAESDAPASSVLDTSADEDLAFCLIMLSRDHWRCPSKKLKMKSEEEERGDSRSFANAEEACGKLQKKAGSKKRRVTGAIHQCPVCNRVFATGQALGGHKRAHIIAINSDEKKNQDDAGKSSTLLDLNLPPPDQNQEKEDISPFLS